MRLDQQSGGQSNGGAASARRLHPFFRDVGITLLAQVAFALLSLLLYRLLAEKAGTDGFASYSLVKQGVGFLFPIVMVGLVGGLPRYLALPVSERGPTSEAYLLAAAGICGGATALVCVIALALPEATAALFFGSSTRTDLVVSFAALLAATTVFQIAYGYFRGLLRVGLAGALQVGAFALPPPLIVLAFSGEPIDRLILFMALAQAALSLLAVGIPLVRSFVLARRRSTTSAGRQLWTYGHRRVAGDVAQLAPVRARAHSCRARRLAYGRRLPQRRTAGSVDPVPCGSPAWAHTPPVVGAALGERPRAGSTIRRAACVVRGPCRDLPEPPSRFSTQKSESASGSVRRSTTRAQWYV